MSFPTSEVSGTPMACPFSHCELHPFYYYSLLCQPFIENVCVLSQIVANNIKSGFPVQMWPNIIPNFWGPWDTHDMSSTTLSCGEIIVMCAPLWPTAVSVQSVYMPTLLRPEKWFPFCFSFHSQHVWFTRWWKCPSPPPGDHRWGPGLICTPHSLAHRIHHSEQGAGGTGGKSISA